MMKACPWCGSREIKALEVGFAPKLFVATCSFCGAKGPPSQQPKHTIVRDGKRAALYLWNERYI